MLQADVIMTPIAAYNVDILHHRSAEAYAVTRYELVVSCADTPPEVLHAILRGDYDDSALRNCIIALATASYLPLINSVGVLGTDAIAAAAAWTSFV